MTKIANQRACLCIENKEDVVYLGEVDNEFEGSEHLEPLNSYYCTSCNSIWTEP